MERVRKEGTGEGEKEQRENGHTVGDAIVVVWSFTIARHVRLELDTGLQFLP
jgi:hypothetical protein